MKKQNHVNINSPISASPVSESIWEENGAIQWLSEYGRYLIFALLAVIAIVLLLYKLVANSNSKADSDYLSADSNFRTFISADEEPSVTEEAFNKLQTIIERRPELHAKYDGLIAQTLINRNQTDLALPFADLAMQRTHIEDRPFFTSYTKTTLLIGNKKYEEALEKAKELEQQMLSKSSNSLTLFAFNLLRIATLQQQLGLKEEELASWKKWKQLSEDHPQAIAPLIRHFQEGKISLLNYIQARENSLKS